MTYQNITKRAVDAATPLEFATPPRTARADLTITIKARVDGFDTEVCYTGSIEQLLAVTKRLRDLGAEPVGGYPPNPAPAPRKAAQRVTPAYDGNGDPICPIHRKPLQEGKWGLFCSAKDRETGEYCRLKFTD